MSRRRWHFDLELEDIKHLKKLVENWNFIEKRTSGEKDGANERNGTHRF